MGILGSLRTLQYQTPVKRQGRMLRRVLPRMLGCNSIRAREATRGMVYLAIPRVALPAAARIGRRSFSSSDEKGEESHDDFKPKRKAPPADLDEALKLIDEQVKTHRIMLYMKGTPSRPMCGFSAQVVRILHASGVDFDSVNVLDYPLIREGVKQYGNWPTIPQLYLDAELVGGCDIVTSLFQSGELAKMFEKSGNKSE